VIWCAKTNNSSSPLTLSVELTAEENRLIMIRQLTAADFDAVIALGEIVHGSGYMDIAELTAIYHKGQWCSVDKWGVDFDDVCYFKSNTIAESGRGQGLGGKLLAASKAAVMAQGAKAGVSHLWQQSPNNAAVRYFTKAGGQLIAQHPQRWHQRYMGEDYICVLCGEDCHCVACEMLLVFNDVPLNQ
jgi:GNAT superfamily N-acetyltransferase